jgi:hypothetical protein
MSQNPLKQFFRQPKIYIGLPSHGIYNKPGTFQGDVERVPIYGMTGMDDILLKTPDALLLGESTVKVLESCCSVVNDAWDICTLDIDILLTAIRIATYGNMLRISHNCPKCNTENEYDIDLANLIDHYSTRKYENKVILLDIGITIRPLTYKQSTDFSIRNFQLQQQLKQAVSITDTNEKQEVLAEMFKSLAVLQNDILADSIESVDIGTSSVTEKLYIKEWLENCDKSVTEEIRNKIQKNQDEWSTPDNQVECIECNTSSTIKVDLDQSTFFANA